MAAKKLISAFVLTVAVCVSAPYTVKAGSPPPMTSTGGASVRGVVRFEGTVPKAQADQHGG